MLTNTQAKQNEIIEAASDTIKTVINSIANNPAPTASGYTYNAAWASRFPAISDLNIITDDGNNPHKTTPERIDRYPFGYFFVDEVKNDPEGAEETFVASLGLFLGVQASTFASAQHEIFEIHHACRTILVSDKQLDVIGRGLLTPTALTGIAMFKGKIVTGTGTSFTTEVIPGDWIALDNDTTKYGVVDTVDSDIKITLTEPYRGSSGMKGDISIVAFVKRGNVLEVLKWDNMVISPPETDGDNIFIDFESYFFIAFREQIYRCC